MWNDDGGNGQPVGNPELSAAQQSIHDAMMEELGLGRRAALPLADRGPEIDLAAVARPRAATSNAWTNFVFDDVEPDSQLDSIADGQLYRMRRGSGYNQQQSTRGARTSTHNSSHSGRGGQASSRGGGGFGSYGGRGGRGNIGKRHEDAIAMLRRAPASETTISVRGGRANRGAIRGGGALRGGGRGGRGGHLNDRDSGRQRQPVPYMPSSLSSERFLASVNAQARVPAVNSGFSDQVKEQRKTPPHLRKRVTFSTDVVEVDAKGPNTPTIVESHKTTTLDNSRWNPVNVDDAPPKNVLNTSVPQLQPQVVQAASSATHGADGTPQGPSPQVQEDHRQSVVAQGRGIRVRIVGNRDSYTGAYRVLQTGSARTLQVKKDIDGLICIDDVITPDTTLFAAIDVPTTVTYSAHHQAGSIVWEIVFSFPHEAEVFQRAAMPGGPQDNLPQAVSVAQAIPARTTEDAVPVVVGGAVPGAPEMVDEAVNKGPRATTQQALLNVSATALLALACVEPILGIINGNELGSFLGRIYELTREVNADSTAAEIIDSGEAYYAAELLAREFFSDSEIYAAFSDAEEEQYIAVLTPRLLEMAVRERDAADPTLVSASAGVSFCVPSGASAIEDEQEVQYSTKSDIGLRDGPDVAKISDGDIAKALAAAGSKKENNPPLDSLPQSHWSSSTDSNIAPSNLKTERLGKGKQNPTGVDVEQLARDFGGYGLDSREPLRPTSSAQSVIASSEFPSVDAASVRRDRGLASLSNSRFADPVPSGPATPASNASSRFVASPTPIFVRAELPTARRAEVEERTKRGIASLAGSAWANGGSGPQAPAVRMPRGHQLIATTVLINNPQGSLTAVPGYVAAPVLQGVPAATGTNTTRSPLAPRNENIQRTMHQGRHR